MFPKKVSVFTIGANFLKKCLYHAIKLSKEEKCFNHDGNFKKKKSVFIMAANFLK